MLISHLGGAASGFIASTAAFTGFNPVLSAVILGGIGSATGSVATQVYDKDFNSVNWSTVMKEGMFGAITGGVLSKISAVSAKSLGRSTMRGASSIRTQGINAYLDVGASISNKLIKNGTLTTTLNSVFADPYLRLGISVENITRHIGANAYIYGSIASNSVGSTATTSVSFTTSWISRLFPSTTYKGVYGK